MTFRNLALASTMLTGLAGLATADELRFDDVFIIGDSLSDAGTYSQSIIAAGMGALPVINYKFLTNAPDGSSLTYGEVLGNSLGLNLGPNVYSAVPLAGQGEVALGGTIYAEGGSRVTSPEGTAFNPAAGVTTRSLSEQVDRLLTNTPKLGENDLVILWGGANDVFAQAASVDNATITPQVAVANMAQAATDLVGLVDRVKASRGRVGHRREHPRHWQNTLWPVSRTSGGGFPDRIGGRLQFDTGCVHRGSGGRGRCKKAAWRGAG